MEDNRRKRGRSIKRNDTSNIVYSNTPDIEQQLLDEPPPRLENCNHPLENETSNNKVNTVPATPEAPVLYMVGHTPRPTNHRSEAIIDPLEGVDHPQSQNGISSPIMRSTRISTRIATQSTKTAIKKKTLKTRKLKLQTKLVSVGSPSKTALSNNVEANINSVGEGGETSNKSNTNNVVETAETVQTSFQQPMDLDSQDTQFDELQLIEASKSTAESIIEERITTDVCDTQETIGDDRDNNVDAGNPQEAESTSVLPNEERNGNIIGNDEEKSDADRTFTWEFSTPPPPCSSNGRSILRSLSATKVPNDDNHCIKSSLNSKVVESKVEFAKVPHKRFFDSKHNRGTNRGKKAIPRPKKRKMAGSDPRIQQRLADANVQLLALGESQFVPTLTGPKFNPLSIRNSSSVNTNFSGQEFNNQVIVLNGDSNLSNGFDTSKLSMLASSFDDSPLVFSQINDSADIFVETQVGIGTDFNKIIFPELQTCEDSITSILKELTSTPGPLESVFSNLNIKTIGDLCGRTKAEINQFPIRYPKERTLKLVLEKYLKAMKASRTKLITAPIKVHMDFQSNQSFPRTSKKQLDLQTHTSQTLSAASFFNSQNHQGPYGNSRLNNSQTLSTTSSIFNLRTESSLNSPILPQSENNTNSLPNEILPWTKETRNSSSINDSKEYDLPDGHIHTNTSTSSTLDFGNLEVIDQLQKFIQGKHGDAFLNQLLSDTTVADKVQSGMINRWHDADEKIVKAKQNQKSTFKNLTEMSIKCLYQEFASRNDLSTLSSEFWNRQLLLLFTSYNDWISERDNENDKTDIRLWVKIFDILKKQHPDYFSECPSDDSSMTNCVKYMINSFSKFPEASLIPEKDILTLLPDLLKMMSPEAQSKFFISRMKFF